MNETDFPITDLDAAGVQMHEFYSAMRRGGFTRLEALYLTATMISGGPKVPSDKEEE